MGAKRAAIDGVLRAAEHGLQHLSVYELTFEPNTSFGRSLRNGTLAAWDDEQLAAMYVEIHELLADRGYEHYEISSYARPGARSVHNSLYWRGAAYLGLGCGAASFFRADDGRSGQRWTNHRSAKKYMAARDTDKVADFHTLDANSLLEDDLWLGLRTCDGVPAQWLEGRRELSDWLLSSGLAEAKIGRIQPTLRGFLYADQVAKRVAASRCTIDNRKRE